MAEEHPTREPSPEASRRAGMLAELKGEIAARLRPVCPHMPASEFDELVDRAAAIELKYMYGGGTSRNWGDR
jgi:hypothetical protein